MTKEYFNKVEPGLLGSKITTFSAVIKKGDESDIVGVRDFTDSASQQADGSTMFGEGSIGKVRYAGLAFMLQQEGIIALQTSAKDFFASTKMAEFLEKKYPERGRELQSEIGKLFSGDNEHATLADLTTHRSGVGDLTGDNFKLFAKEGIEREYNIPDLVIIPDADRIPLGTNGRPKHQTNPDHPDAKYGAHQYSNLGYMLLGLAMEEAYDAKNPAATKDEIKDYKKLMNDFMLHPVEGRAVGKVEFKETKFPEKINDNDNLARSRLVENDRLVDAHKFSGANAAGGMFASANDSVKFFNEFFRGFPGTEDAKAERKETNKFFSDETVALMMAEAQKFPTCGGAEKPTNRRFQGPGFAVDLNSENKPELFNKSGRTFGYTSMMRFEPENNSTRIRMCANENVTEVIAIQRGESINDVLLQYREGGGQEVNRSRMIAENKPELLSQRERVGAAVAGEVGDAVHDLAEVLKRNQAASTDETTVGEVQAKTNDCGAGR